MKQDYNQSPQEVIDTNIASRILSDAELLKAGAVVINGVLAPTDAQIENIAADHDSQPINSSQGSVQGHQENSAETEHSHEELINEIVGTAAIAAHLWLRYVDVPSQYFFGSGGNSFSNIINQRGRKPVMSGPLRSSTFKAFKEEFAAKHVSELLTIGSVQGSTFGDFEKDSPAGSEEAVMVKYEPLSDQSNVHTPYRWHVHGASGGGQGLNLTMIMPNTLAQKLKHVAEQEPQVVRELVDTVMSREFELGDSWKEVRPPYETWQALNNGVNRIALRTDMAARVDSSQVLEF
jgi:hypothetical protein